MKGNNSPTEHPIDFKYSLEFLHKLNALTCDDKSVAAQFTYRGYDLWQSYQQILFERIKQWSRTKKNDDQYKISFMGMLKNFIVGFSAALLAICSFLVCMLFRRRIAVYSMDRTTAANRGDFRLEELYEALHETNIRPLEIFHTVLSRSTVINFFFRARPALYLELPDWIFPWGSAGDDAWLTRVNVSSFSTSDEQEFARALLRATATQRTRSIRRVNFWRIALDLLGVETLFLIDDGRYYTELILAARFAGIKTVAIQHGHFTKYHVGWLTTSVPAGTPIVPDLFLLWTEYWKQELKRLGTFIPESVIEIGGIRTMKKNFSVQDAHKGTTILVPYEIDAPKHQVAAHIRAFLDCANLNIIFKLRPGFSEAEQLSAYRIEDLKNHPQLIVSFDTRAALKAADAVAGTYSTFLYDSVAELKPIFILDADIDFGVGMVENGLAERISLVRACEIVKRVAEIPKETLVARKEKLYGAQPSLLKNTLIRILSTTQ